jgi:hypothetical protein
MRRRCSSREACACSLRPFQKCRSPRRPRLFKFKNPIVNSVWGHVADYASRKRAKKPGVVLRMRCLVFREEAIAVARKQVFASRLRKSRGLRLPACPSSFESSPAHRSGPCVRMRTGFFLANCRNANHDWTNRLHPCIGALAACGLWTMRRLGDQGWQRCSHSRQSALRSAALDTSATSHTLNPFNQPRLAACRLLKREMSVEMVALTMVPLLGSGNTARLAPDLRMNSPVAKTGLLTAAQSESDRNGLGVTRGRRY